MGAVRELSERFWSGAVSARELWKPTGASEEIVPGVVFLHAFANVTAAHAARAEIYRARADAEAALMTRGIFQAAAADSEAWARHRSSPASAEPTR